MTDMETKVVTYNSPGAYARDVQRQQAQGWEPVDSENFLKRRSVTGSALVPFSLLKGRKSQLVITYQRGSSTGYTLAERLETAKEQRQAQKDATEERYAQARAADPHSRAGEYVGPKWLGIRRNR